MIFQGIRWLIKAKEISILKDYVNVIDDISWEQLDRIVDLEYKVSELEELCLAKDAQITELASELLRRGSSIGGHLMADRKAFLNAAA